MDENNHSRGRLYRSAAQSDYTGVMSTGFQTIRCGTIKYLKSGSEIKISQWCTYVFLLEDGTHTAMHKRVCSTRKMYEIKCVLGCQLQGLYKGWCLEIESGVEGGEYRTVTERTDVGGCKRVRGDNFSMVRGEEYEDWREGCGRRDMTFGRTVVRGDDEWGVYYELGVIFVVFVEHTEMNTNMSG
ncbi:hypothetical protein Tco_0893795 [Tanacetum coccineum]|uniref:Uncharacterized protein n=1 Tax=Tanacetum coccineum TaxID=301880 RepID=A0ABQ5CB76_9ASTR